MDPSPGHLYEAGSTALTKRLCSQLGFGALLEAFWRQRGLAEACGQPHPVAIPSPTQGTSLFEPQLKLRNNSPLCVCARVEIRVSFCQEARGAEHAAPPQKREAGSPPDCEPEPSGLGSHPGSAESRYRCFKTGWLAPQGTSQGL